MFQKNSIVILNLINIIQKNVNGLECKIDKFLFLELKKEKNKNYNRYYKNITLSYEWSNSKGLNYIF